MNQIETQKNYIESAAKLLNFFPIPPSSPFPHHYSLPIKGTTLRDHKSIAQRAQRKAIKHACNIKAKLALMAARNRSRK